MTSRGRGARVAGRTARRSASPYAACAVAASWIAGPLLGQAVEPEVSMAPDVTEIHVGDPLRVEISVRHAGTLGVVWPDSLDVSPFEVVSIAESAPRSDGDVLVSRATLTVTAFELGELELPALPLELSGPDGTASRVFTDPVVIGVTSVGLDEGGDIRDVRGPRAIARSWLSFWPWFVLLVLAVGAGYWLARRGDRPSRTTRPDRPGEPPRPAHEIALEALERLEASPLLERGDIKRYHIEVSQIVRAYLEGRYRIWALEMVTPDVVAGLRDVGIEASTRDGFQSFLEACDLVKFAKRRPSERDCRTLLETARELVHATKFVPPPETEAVASS